MTLSEKSAYLKGLMEGMKLDTETNEGKLISEIISMLQDVAENVSDLEEVVDCISDELDCIEEDLDNIDDYLMDDDDDEYDDEYDEDDDYEDISDEDDADDQDEYDFGTETLYEVKCPTCGESSPSTRRCSTKALPPARTAAKSSSSTWKTRSRKTSKSNCKAPPEGRVSVRQLTATVV